MACAKRWPLLSAAQEIHLAHRVQKWLLVQRALDMNTGDARERIALPTEPEPEEYYGGASPGGL